MEDQTTPNPEIELIKSLAVSELKNLKIQQELEVTKITGEIPWGEKFLQSDMLTLLREITADVEGSLIDDEQLAICAMRNLDRTEQKRFITKNLLEGLKNGKKLDDLLKTYNEIGLISLPNPTNTEDINHENILRKPVGFLKKFNRKLDHIDSFLGNLLVSTLESSKGNIKVKPVFNLGFGPVIIEADFTATWNKLAALWRKSAPIEDYPTQNASTVTQDESDLQKDESATGKAKPARKRK